MGHARWLIVVVASGCAPDTEPAPPPQAPPPGLVSVVSEYRLESAGDCTRADFTTLYDGEPHAPGIVGFAPDTVGVTYPLFVFMGGTFAKYDADDILQWVAIMAEKGFVAVSVEYDNGLPGGCTSVNADAMCVFDPTKPRSAISALCTRDDVDCDKGIVVAGHSQGFHVTQRAASYDARVRAALGLGATCDYTFNLDAGICNPDGGPEETCLLDENTALPASRVRLISGDRDDYGDQGQYERVSGKTCAPDTLDCLNDDGSGWYRIASADVEDFHGEHDPERTGWGADHCFWVNSTDGQWCPAVDDAHPFDKNWLPPANLPWSLDTNLNWLARFIL